jgi:hypothetical protein
LVSRALPKIGVESAIVPAAIIAATKMIQRNKHTWGYNIQRNKHTWGYTIQRNKHTWGYNIQRNKHTWGYNIQASRSHRDHTAAEYAKQSSGNRCST